MFMCFTKALKILSPAPSDHIEAYFCWQEVVPKQNTPVQVFIVSKLNSCYRATPYSRQKLQSRCISCKIGNMQNKPQMFFLNNPASDTFTCMETEFLLLCIGRALSPSVLGFKYRVTQKVGIAKFYNVVYLSLSLGLGGPKVNHPSVM